MSGTPTFQTTELPVVQAESSCACCSTPAASGPATAADETGLVESTYLVTGLTCGGCAGSVTRTLEGLEGVSSVQVDIVSGGESSVRVASEVALTDEQVRATLAEAGGYALVSAG